MPREYLDKVITIQCNDCLKKSNVPFHIFGGKCRGCRSYNTTRLVDEVLDTEEIMKSGANPAEESKENGSSE